MDKLTALNMFCTLADTLQFRETAARLSVSPQVVSRVIGELEEALGDSLFQRNTRQVQLSDFGQQMLPQARQIVAESAQFFTQKQAVDAQDMAGTVRITAPDAPLMYAVLPRLLDKLHAYPNLHLDWRMAMKMSDKVGERIDIGIRAGNAPSDNSLIVKKVGELYEQIVAAPELVARCGLPENLTQLAKTYPLAAYLDDNSGRVKPWYFTNEQILDIATPHFASNNLAALLAAARSGQCAVFLHHTACAPHLATGELVELLPDEPRKRWGIYLYRPHRHITPPRVKKVFDLLAECFAETAA